MEFSEGINRASEIAKKVMTMMDEKGIPALPKIYAVLYAYIADSNPDLSKEVEDALNDIERLPTETLPILYDKHYGFSDAEEALDDATKQMNGKMGSIIEMLEIASGDTKEFGGDLKLNMANLKADPKNLSAILATLFGQTESILQKNELLQNRLEESSEEINSLQKNLGSAKKEAMVDGLTGLGNRRCFDSVIKSSVNTADASDSALCIAMTDIDHFKAFNDSYGHQTGDKVLKAVAQIIDKGMRDEDVVTRYGGEEFALILPNMDLNAAFALCERVRVAVSRKKLRNRKSGQDLGRINISIGLAQHNKGESVFDFIQRADASLYQAKENGRNMTIRAQQNP